jgi:RHS repeat-associated protein
MPKEGCKTLPFPPGSIAYAAYMCAGDGQGDAVTQTRTHDNANEILTISGISLAPLYDQAGNNVRGPRPADPNANNAAHFRYDAWNRLATIHLDNGSAPGTLDGSDTLLATYRYDGLNRRVKKVTHADANTTIQYMYYNENWQIVEVRRGVNQTPTAAPYKQYAWDIRYIDAPVCRWWDDDANSATAAKLHYFTNDGNFNTTSLVDANSGSVVERYLYDPYGKPTFLDANWAPRSSSSYDNEILYCGYWYDPETGLYHVRERYYDPITGTWKTRDKILYPDGMNLYEYCRSNALIGRDPYGLEIVIALDEQKARENSDVVKTPATPTTEAVYFTWKEIFDREVAYNIKFIEAKNKQIDSFLAKLKKLDDYKGKFICNDKEVSKEEMLNSIENMKLRMEMISDTDTNRAYDALASVAHKAGPTSEVVYESHGGPVTQPTGPEAPPADESIAHQIRLAGKEVPDKEFAKELREALDKRGIDAEKRRKLKLTLGLCLFTDQAQLQAIANELGMPVAGSFGDKHMLRIEVSVIEGERDTKNKTLTIKVITKSPFEFMDFQAKKPKTPTTSDSKP